MATPCQASTTCPPSLLKTDCPTDRRGGGRSSHAIRHFVPSFLYSSFSFSVAYARPPSPHLPPFLAQTSTHVMGLPFRSPSLLESSSFDVLVTAHLLVLHTWHAVRHDRAVADLQAIQTFEKERFKYSKETRKPFRSITFEH